jgi:4,5-DOPA dioxygenase extradiol
VVRIPSVFVSHGSPGMLLGESPVRAFLQGLGDALPPVRAVLCVSAHWETKVATLATTQNPETIHNFYGFPDALYRVRYPAPGVGEQSPWNRKRRIA